MTRRPHAKGPGHERWLVSYADLLTLLFAFFVVMYAVGHSDVTQVHRLTQAIMAAFSELGMFQPAQMENQLKPLMSVGYQARQDREDAVALASLRERMQTEMAPLIHNHMVSMDLTREGLVIRVEESGFFDSGSDQLRPEALPVLQEIADQLRPLPNDIRVEGHTDNVPIHTALFDSNWQLSSMRAALIAELLTTRFTIEPSRVSAAGFAEFRPVADNGTPEGRQQNRRVDVVVISQSRSAPLSPPGSDVPSAHGPPSPVPDGPSVTGARTPPPGPASPPLAATPTPSGLLVQAGGKR